MWTAACNVTPCFANAPCTPRLHASRNPTLVFEVGVPARREPRRSCWRSPEGRGVAGGARPRSVHARSARPCTRRPSRARRRGSAPGRSRPRSAAWCSSRRHSSRTRSAPSSSCPLSARSARRWRCAAVPHGACAGGPARATCEPAGRQRAPRSGGDADRGTACWARVLLRHKFLSVHAV